MLDGKINLNLQNDYLLNRSNTSVAKKQEEIPPSNKKSKTYWTATSVAALTASVLGGIYYVRHGRLPKNFDPSFNPKFEFDFASSVFAKTGVAEKLSKPEKLIVEGIEGELTNIIKLADDKFIKFNDDKTLMNIISGKNVLNIAKESSNEISQLFINGNLTPVTINKFGKIKTSVLHFDSEAAIGYKPKNSEYLDTEITESIAKKILKQFDLNKFVNESNSAADEKLFNNWFRKIRVDNVTGDAAKQLGITKKEMYALMRTQNFRQLLKNQDEIIDSGYVDVVSSLRNDYGVFGFNEAPTNFLPALLSKIARGDNIIHGVVENSVIDGNHVIPKMLNVTSLSTSRISSADDISKGVKKGVERLTYNPDKSYIHYTDDLARDIEKYTPKVIDDKHPKVTSVAGPRGAFYLEERPSLNEIIISNNTGSAHLTVKYTGDISNPTVQSASIKKKALALNDEGIKDTYEIRSIAPDSEILRKIFDNFSMNVFTHYAFDSTNKAKSDLISHYLKNVL